MNYSSAFQNNQPLRQYILNDVTPTEITLGTGSYGSVVEVKRSHYCKLMAMLARSSVWQSQHTVSSFSCAQIRHG